MARFCYLITNCLSNDDVFKFASAGVSELLVSRLLILLHFIHIGGGVG